VLSAKRGVFVSTLLVFAATWIAPLWPVEQALHSSLTVLGLALLWAYDRRAPMRPMDFAAIFAFIPVHCVAARWLYSGVPYDRWLQALAGWSPNQAFGLTRNHADRVIHLMFGLCFTPALGAEALRRWPSLTARQAAVLAVGTIMCASLLYEWLEWAVALTLSPAQAESYNGQQGDMWDAHADMLLATVGALLVARPFRRAIAR